MNEQDISIRVLELSIRTMSDAFDDFIGGCIENGKPKAPDIKALAKARAYLPPYCKNAYRK